MKIGLVLDDQISKPGGIQEYVKGLYRYLKSSGCKVKIISSGEYQETIPKEDQILIGKPFKIDYANDVSSFPLLSLFSKELKRILGQERFDLFNFQAPFGTLSSKIIDLDKKSKKVAIFHINHDNFPLAKRLGFKLYSQWANKYLKHCDSFLACSEVAKNFALRSFTINPQFSFQVIPCGIDIQRFSIKYRSYNQKLINILFVGRLMERKGIMYLLNAYKKIARQQSNLKLTIVGNGSYQERIENKIKKEKIPNINLAGFINDKDLPKFYQKADIFCAPSLDGESFGIVLVEAMAAGLPICGFANEGYKTVIPRTAQDFFPEPGDQENLTKVLLELVENYKLRSKQGEENQKWSQNYDWEKVGKSVLNIFQKTFNER